MLQFSSCVLRGHAQQLKLHSFLPLAIFSSAAFSQSIDIDSLLQLQTSREKTSLEFSLPSLTSCGASERLVCFAAGGKRPRRPHIWKSRPRRGSFNKADKLLESLESVSNIKEEVYGALDAFVAWELDFPLITVKKALGTLQREKNWPRIIQIIKWMLGKGQGRSLGTYHLLLKAFSEEGRTEEAQDLFKKVFSRNLECTPLKLFSEIMRMYERHEMYEDILEVFADMEELNVRPDASLSEIISGTYEKIGDMERAYRVRLKFTAPKFRWRTIHGRTFKFRNEDKDVAVSRWTKDTNFNEQAEQQERSLAAARQAQEDLRDLESAVAEDLESADDEELEIDEDENQGYRNDVANEVYFRHLHARKEMYA
ncbi:hypothetical protein L7F22_004535 [Adiantum nelumboides]|nr:hypothetical protein [Adiantum nelumboides]